MTPHACAPSASVANERDTMTTNQILDNAINDAAARMFKTPRLKVVQAAPVKPQIKCDCCGKMTDEESACASAADIARGGGNCEDCQKAIDAEESEEHEAAMDAEYGVDHDENSDR